jgi:hypothetical protein
MASTGRAIQALGAVHSQDKQLLQVVAGFVDLTEEVEVEDKAKCPAQNRNFREGVMGEVEEMHRDNPAL